IRQIEQRLKVRIQNRSNVFLVSGEPEAVKDALAILKRLYALTESESSISPDMIHLAIQEAGDGEWSDKQQEEDESDAGSFVQIIRTPKSSVKPRSRHQNDYVRAIMRHDINFGIGPAGTGKTF